MHSNATQPLLQKAKVWRSITKKAYDFLSFDQLKRIYDILFEHEPLPIAWIPDEASQDSNLAKAMKKLHIQAYASFYQWSVEHKEQFWQMAIEQLDIQLDHPFDQILQTDTGLENPGLENPTWLPGARLNIVRSCFKAKPDKTALMVSDENNNTKSYTYQQLDSLTRQVASGLTALGLQPKDRVVMYLPLGLEAVAAYLGIIRAGMAAVLVADSFSAQELSKRIAISQAKALITVDEYQYNGKTLSVYEKVKAAQAPQTIVVSPAGGTDLREEDLKWEEFLGEEKVDYYISDPGHMISLLFSSGTTQDPKAIPWTQLTPIKCATDAFFHQDVHPGDVLTWTTGMGWMMGPWTIFAALINNATLALFTGSAASKAFGRFVEKAGVTILGTIPSLVKVWRSAQMMENLSWKVRLFSSTGEPSQAEDYLYLMWLARFKAPVIEYCGGTEIGGGYLTGSVMQPASPATFTTPALGMQLVFRDEATGQVSAHEAGEVFIVPPSIGLSQQLLNRDHHEEYYAGTPTLGSLPRTGSGGIPLEGIPLRRHGDSYLKVSQVQDTIFYKSRGRTDDAMNLGGIKVSAVEIEKILNEHPAVTETAAVAVAPAGGGPEQLVVFYVPTQENLSKEVLKKQLQQKLSEELNPLFRIKDVIAKESLPRTASNKLMRRALRE